MKRIHHPVLLVSPVELAARNAQSFKTCLRYGRRGAVILVSSATQSDAVVLKPTNPETITLGGTECFRNTEEEAPKMCSCNYTRKSSDM